MNLGKKKKLAAKALKVGEKRIIFVKPRLDEIKEAITKQDIKDLKKDGAIMIRDVKGRKKTTIKRKKRGIGRIKKRVNIRKKIYVTLTRKLRAYVAELKKEGRLNRDEVKDIRNKIRNRVFRSKAHLREYIRGLKK